MRANQKIVIALTASLLLTTSKVAFSCSCAPDPAACQAVGQSPLVFLGTVTDVSQISDTPFKTAQMKIDRAFKGDLKETIQLFDDGMCDGPNLVPGKQYLMYTYGDPTKAVPARGCSRSRSIEDAKEDLEFLNQYAAGSVSTFIAGTVRFRPDEPQDSKLDDRGRTPLRGVKITLRGTGGISRMVTDFLGNFKFTNLPSGHYTIDAELPGYFLNWGPEDIELRANGCVQPLDLLMKIDRRAEGVVTDQKGAPIRGARVEMIQVDGQSSWPPVLLSSTDEKGWFRIDGIPPGEYYLGVNIKSIPTKRTPYLPTYYPGTPRFESARRIKYGNGASVRQLGFRVMGTLPLINIHGQILHADGTPPTAEEYPQIIFRESARGMQIFDRNPIEIDADGRFQYEFCEGIRYSASAFTVGKREMYSALVEFIPTKDNNELKLVLDKTRKQFSNLPNR
jgi:hypothetical protein